MCFVPKLFSVSEIYTLFLVGVDWHEQTHKYAKEYQHFGMKLFLLVALFVLETVSAARPRKGM